jgi:hypothetical protein
MALSAPPGAESACHEDCQMFPRILVDHRQQAKLAAAIGAILHEVLCPDVMAKRRLKPLA